MFVYKGEPLMTRGTPMAMETSKSAQELRPLPGQKSQGAVTGSFELSVRHGVGDKGF